MNNQIRAREVRLIDEEGEQAGVVSLDEAIDRAKSLGMDLVEISKGNEVPVCRIMDYGKYQYQLSKKAAAAKKNQKQMQLKEIKFRPGTDEGDYNIKLRKLTTFLEEGNKAKVTLRYRGREMAHQEIGRALLERIKKDLEDCGTVEQFPKMEGRQTVMVLGPKKKGG
tara:strand:- start:71425 stop:71925 length:501 start_codon:yes stop_codon:yes gene_type:complete